MSEDERFEQAPLPRRGRYALFLPSLAGGGAERVTLNLARGFRSLGHDVDLVVASNTGELRDQVPADVRLVDLGTHRTLTALPHLARYLRRERPTGLLSAMNHVNIVAVWAAWWAGYRGPVLAAEHVHVAPAGRSVRKRAFLALLGLAYRRTHRVIAVSHGIKQGLIERAGVPEDRITVIYNPVIGSDLASRTRPRPEDLPSDDTPVIVGMGRLSEQKNFELLLSAFADVRAARRARLVILGEGPLRDRLTESVRRHGLADDVDMPGFVANPYDYLAHADLFALSSDWEGLPTVLIEALALGTPVVATDCPTGPREILDHGAFGRLVPVGDRGALATAMLDALRSPTQGAPAAWLEQFEELAAAKAYLRAFDGSGGAPPAVAKASTTR